MEEQLRAAGITNEQRTPCEVWTRCMGYYRPTSFFNLGKQQEQADRRHFTEQAAGRLLT